METLDKNVGQTAEKSTQILSATSSNIDGTPAAKESASSFLNNLTFWKNSGRAVPGRPSLKHRGAGVTGAAVVTGTTMVSTFRDYQQSVSDAWDTGDDEFCIISSSEAAATAAAGGAVGETTRISRQVSQTVATHVIEKHSQNNQNYAASTQPNSRTTSNNGRTAYG